MFEFNVNRNISLAMDFPWQGISMRTEMVISFAHPVFPVPTTKCGTWRIQQTCIELVLGVASTMEEAE